MSRMHDYVERVAKAMYEAPDTAEPDYFPSKWPPRSSEDRDFFMNLAWVAINAGTSELINMHTTLEEDKRYIKKLEDEIASLKEES